MFNVVGGGVGIVFFGEFYVGNKVDGIGDFVYKFISELLDIVLNFNVVWLIDLMIVFKLFLKNILWIFCGMIW